MNLENIIPSDEPVRLLSAVAEELDYSRLTATYSRLGRIESSPRLLFKIVLYGCTRGIYATRELERACRETDPDATFMHMKEDHMKNGQLKPGYNVNTATVSEYIVGNYISADRTDTKTFIPFLKKLCISYPVRRVVVDSGYESEENYRRRDPAPGQSFHSGGGRVCRNQGRSELPPISDQRKCQCYSGMVSCEHGV